MCCSDQLNPPSSTRRAADVVGQIGHADLHMGARDADRSDDEAHRSLLLREHMLDGAADFRFLCVSDAHALGHRPTRWLLAVNARHEATRRQHGFVLRRPLGRVRPDVAGRVRPVQHVFETRPIVRGRVRGCPVADQAEAAIDRDVIFVAERRDRQVDRRQAAVLARRGLGVFNRPARVAVLLRELRRLVPPVVGDAAFLDRGLLLDRIALLGRRHDRGVGDLTTHRQEAFRAQRRVEPPEQGIDGARLLQRLAEGPGRIGVGNTVSQSRPRKRMNDSRSLIRNSVRSSDNACIA